MVVPQVIHSPSTSWPLGSHLFEMLQACKRCTHPCICTAMVFQLPHIVFRVASGHCSSARQVKEVNVYALVHGTAPSAHAHYSRAPVHVPPLHCGSRCTCAALADGSCTSAPVPHVMFRACYTQTEIPAAASYSPHFALASRLTWSCACVPAFMSGYELRQHRRCAICVWPVWCLPSSGGVCPAR
jgi:hypothetical protein